MGALNRYRQRQRANWAAYNVLTDVPSLYWWGRADTTVNAGGFASSVLDKSGGLRHYLQATGSKQAALNATDAFMNNRASLTYDGVDDAMTIAAFGALTDATFFHVTRSIAATATAGRIFIVGNTVDAQALCVLTPGSSQSRPVATYANPGSTFTTRSVDASAADAKYAGTAPIVWSVAFDHAAAASAALSTRARLGEPVSTNSASNATQSTIANLGSAFGATKAGAAAYQAFTWAETIVCSAVLTIDQRRVVEDYLAGYYGLV